MRNAIVKKLRKHLSGDIETECGVVYLLCEIRKLLDMEPPDPPPFALRLYCHWALHVDLSYPSTTLKFLERVDSYVVTRLTWQETGESIVSEHNLFREFVYLETLQKELSEFLRRYGLPTALCEDARWHKFLAAYAGVIEDGSLTCESKGSDKLQIVKKVTFTKGRDSAEGHVPFSMIWDILLKDGRRLEVEVGTLVNQMMHWGLRLIPA